MKKNKLAIFIVLCSLFFSLFSNKAFASNSWEVLGSAGFSATTTENNSMAVDSNNVPYVAFQDPSTYRAVVMKYNGISWSTVGSNPTSSLVFSPVIAISNDNFPYIAFAQNGYQATVLKYDGSSWVTVGAENFSSGQVTNLSLSFDKNNTPYISYTDNGGKATVMKFNGSSWVNVGIPRFSTSSVYYGLSMTIDKNNSPYVTYTDSVTYEVIVMKFDGSSWVKVGNNLGNSSSVTYGSVAFDSSNVPYVAFQDTDNSAKVTVKKFNGSSWVAVGTLGFSEGAETNISILFDSNDVPYLSYQDDYTTSYKATVKKFNGTSWVTVGTRGFSAGRATSIYFSIDSSNNLYVGYKDWANSNKATVMRYSVGIPTLNYSSSFTESLSNDGSLTGSIIATIENDTFVNPNSNLTEGVHYTIANKPAGLTAVMSVNSGGTAATLTLIGNATNNLNSNDVNNLTITFLDGAFVDTPLASNVIFSTYNTGVIDFFSPSISYSGSYTEYSSNNGNLSNDYIRATLIDDTFKSSLVEGVDYTITNKPAGVTAMMTVSNDRTYADLYFTGNATNNSSSDSISNLTITFLDGAFTNTAHAVDVDNYFYNQGVINFIDSNLSYSSEFKESSNNDGSITGSRVITLTNNVNTKFVNQSATLTEGVHYTIANKPAGLTAVMSVSGDGTVATLTFTGNATSHTIQNSVYNLTITFLDGAFTNDVSASNITNYTNTMGRIIFIEPTLTYTGSFYEAPRNNGSIDSSIVVTLDSDSDVVFARQNSTLNEGRDYTIANLPPKLNSKIKINSDGKQATITLFGKATHHLNENDISNLTITFLDDAFEGITSASSIINHIYSTGVIDFFTNPSTSWLPVGGMGISDGQAEHTRIAIDNNNIPYIVYENGAYDKNATVMRYYHNNWVTVGNAPFATGSLGYLTFAFDKNTIPYVTYQDYDNDYKAAVKKFNGTSWVPVGDIGFSPGQVESMDLAFDGSNTPYIAYKDVGNASKITVKKFDGTSWLTVGGIGFSSGQVSNLDIAIGSDNVPYVVYDNLTGDHKATVKKFDGESWVTVGSESFTAGGFSYPSLLIDNNNTPYFAFQDFTNDYKAAVMKFDGSSWVLVGDTGFSMGTDYQNYLIADKNNDIYLAYGDVGNNYKTTVRKFDGTSWVPVGDDGFTPGWSYYPSLAVNSENNLYIVYKDVENDNKATVMKLVSPSLLEPISTLSVTPNDTNVLMSWSVNQVESSHIKSYLIKNKLSQSDDWDILPSDFVGNNSATVTGLSEGQNYDFEVNAVDENLFNSAPIKKSLNIRYLSRYLSRSSGYVKAPTTPKVVNTSEGSVIPDTKSAGTNNPVKKSLVTFLSNKILKVKTVDGDVKNLQHFLNNNNYVVSIVGAGSPGNETTFFGNLTKKALVKFQKDHGLKADGIFGPKTREIIEIK